MSRILNAFSVGPVSDSDPRVVAALQPWAEISERLRRNIWAEISDAFGVTSRLKFANAFGVFKTGPASDQ